MNLMEGCAHGMPLVQLQRTIDDEMIDCRTRDVETDDAAGVASHASFL